MTVRFKISKHIIRFLEFGKPFGPILTFSTRAWKTSFWRFLLHFFSGQSLSSLEPVCREERRWARGNDCRRLFVVKVIIAAACPASAAVWSAYLLCLIFVSFVVPKPYFSFSMRCLTWNLNLFTFFILKPIFICMVSLLIVVYISLPKARLCLMFFFRFLSFLWCCSEGLWADCLCLLTEGLVHRDQI